MKKSISEFLKSNLETIVFTEEEKAQHAEIFKNFFTGKQDK